MNPKIVSKTHLGRILRILRKRGEKIIFTNGCFDILHVGHIKYLQKAKRIGGVFIVALNTDSSVRKLKGRNRPINPQGDRAEVLAAMECVDYVVFFNESTPAEIIRFVKPDVLVKGSEYKIKDIVGNDTVKSCGGRVITIPMIKGKSTSGIIRKVRGER